MAKELFKRHIVWVRIGPVLRCEWVMQRIVSLVPRVRLNHLRPADPAVTVLQKEPVYTHTLLEWEAWHAAQGKAPGFISRQRLQRASVVRSLHVVSAGKTKAWRWPGCGLARLNTFSRLWGMEVVPGCLLPGPGVVRI